MAEPFDLRVQGFVVAFLRKLADQTQQEFGKSAGVDQSDLSKYEAGKREAPEDSLRRMAKVAGVDDSFLALLRRVYAALLSVIERKNPFPGVEELVREVLKPVLLAVLPGLLEEEMEEAESPSPEEERREAEETWTALEQHPIPRRRYLIELTLMARKSLPLARRIGEASAVAEDRGEARELAELALSIAERGWQDLLDRDLPYDAAVAALDLAAPWLAAGRPAEVRELAVSIEKIFQANDIGREALAALKPFCEAAKQETATVELARRVGEQLQRAQREPGLRFGG